MNKNDDSIIAEIDELLSEPFPEYILDNLPKHATITRVQNKYNKCKKIINMDEQMKKLSASNLHIINAHLEDLRRRGVTRDHELFIMKLIFFDKLFDRIDCGYGQTSSNSWIKSIDENKYTFEMGKNADGFGDIRIYAKNKLKSIRFQIAGFEIDTALEKKQGDADGNCTYIYHFNYFTAPKNVLRSVYENVSYNLEIELEDNISLEQVRKNCYIEYTLVYLIGEWRTQILKSNYIYTILKNGTELCISSTSRLPTIFFDIDNKAHFEYDNFKLKTIHI